MQPEYSEGGSSIPVGEPLEPLRRLFFDSNGRLVERLARATACNDVQTALHLAHALRGAALFAGFSQLAEMASETEAHLRRSEVTAARSTIDRTRWLLSAAGP